jgi:spermidine synthase
MDAIESKGWRYAPHVVVFFGSAFIMVLELVAGRLIARHLGNSLYTWTSVIGVVLAGMSLGNYVGGRLADRWRPERILGLIFLAASVLCVSVLPLNRFFADASPLGNLLWPLRTFCTVLLIFALPAVALGAISPAAAKMAVERGESIGRTIGSVYAWGAMGSILGTFATGFWLIAVLGAKDVVLSVSLCLAVMALLIGPGRWVAGLWAALLASLLVFSLLPERNAPRAEAAIQWFGLREDPEYLFARDSNYQFVSVSEQLSDEDSSRTVRRLNLDYLIHGYLDLGDPSHLEYSYEKVYRDVLRRCFGTRPVSAFFIGGGSYTFPRWVLHQWPGSRIDVAEIDPLVLEANHAALGLAKDAPIRTFLGDARIVVDGMPRSTRYDLIVGDAFNDLSVPFHLTTLEFNEKIAALLSPGGVYLVNMIDSWGVGDLLSAYVATLRKTFPHVRVFCTEANGVKGSRETFVLAASMSPLDFDDVGPGHAVAFEGSLIGETEILRLAARTRPRILTDDYAPVENLLEPVVRDRN